MGEQGEGTMKLLATASAVLLSIATTVTAQTLDELKNDGQLNEEHYRAGTCIVMPRPPPVRPGRLGP